MEQPQPVAAIAKADDDEFIEFVRAGERVVGSFQCAACGHGAVVRAELPSCPMCQGTLWERSTWTPFATALDGLRRIRAQ